MCRWQVVFLLLTDKHASHKIGSLAITKRNMQPNNFSSLKIVNDTQSLYQLFSLLKLTQNLASQCRFEETLAYEDAQDILQTAVRERCPQAEPEVGIAFSLGIGVM